jgi:hypothetical protein
MHNRTEAVRLKVKRAKHHIAEMDRRIHLFFTGQPNPYPILKEIDPETGDAVFKLGKCSPIPEDFPLIIGDVLQNLRSALDHLVWQLILSYGNPPKIGASGFPISKSAKEYEYESPRKIKGMAPEAMKMIDALKPYSGGNEDLFGLHILNNADKHRLLLLVGAAHLSTALQIQLSPTPTEFIIPMPFQLTYPLNDGAVIYRIPKWASNFKDDPKFTFRIAFGDAEVMGSDPMLPPLDQLANLIDAIIIRIDKFMQ